VKIPHGHDGNDYIFVVVDVNDQVFEGTTRGQSTGRTLTPMTVHTTPLPDLAVASGTGPAAGQPGQAPTVHWTAPNPGPADAAGPWNDQVYISTDGTLTGATLLATVPHPGGLASQAAENDSAGVMLPTLPDGADHFVVVVDAGNAVYESNEANNLAA